MTDGGRGVRRLLAVHLNTWKPNAIFDSPDIAIRARKNSECKGQVYGAKKAR